MSFSKTGLIRLKKTRFKNYSIFCFCTLYKDIYGNQIKIICLFWFIIAKKVGDRQIWLEEHRIQKKEEKKNNSISLRYFALPYHSMLLFLNVVFLLFFLWLSWSALLPSHDRHQLRFCCSSDMLSFRTSLQWNLYAGQVLGNIAVNISVT